MRKFASLSFVLALLCIGVSAGVSPGVSITTFDTPITQDFDSLASTGTTNTTTPGGWGFLESGSNANTNYRAGNGSDNAGDTYSFGATGATERAFGGLQSGTLIPTIGAQFTNNTGGTITSLVISYTGEQWRLGATGRQDRLDFQYSTNATALNTGTYIDVDALDFASPITAGTVGALDGNAAANRTVVSSTINGLSIPNGASFFIRWTDFNPSGSDDGLAIDDFSLTASGVVTPTASISVNDVTLSEGNAGTTTASFTVSVAGPHPDGVTFNIATDDGGGANPATAGSGDYLSRSEIAQTIPAGASTFTFDVTVNGDSVIENNEQFVVNLSGVIGATVTDAQGIGTINNDDAVISDVVISQVYGLSLIHI